MYFYKVYGLVVASELVLPELVVTPATDIPDVTILVRPVPEVVAGASYRDPYFQVAGNVCQVQAEGVARYRVEEGQRILVDAEPGVAAGDLRLYLLGSALGAVLHQRNCLPLHVSSVVTPNGVWAFTGDSGAGKSTLAAALHYKFGWPILSDDVGVVIQNELGQMLFHPGPPRLKLWQDAINHFGINQGDLVPDFIRANKFHLKIEEGFEQQPQILSALVILERTRTKEEEPQLLLIEGIKSFQSIIDSIYRLEFVPHLNSTKSIFLACGVLADRLQVYSYRRPWLLDNIDKSLDTLLAKMI
jgi:hypothetical protein